MSFSWKHLLSAEIWDFRFFSDSFQLKLPVFSVVTFRVFDQIICDVLNLPRQQLGYLLKDTKTPQKHPLNVVRYTRRGIWGVFSWNFSKVSKGFETSKTLISRRGQNPAFWGPGASGPSRTGLWPNPVAYQSDNWRQVGKSRKSSRGDRDHDFIGEKVEKSFRKVENLRQKSAESRRLLARFWGVLERFCGF